MSVDDVNANLDELFADIESIETQVGRLLDALDALDDFTGTSVMGPADLPDNDPAFTLESLLSEEDDPKIARGDTSNSNPNQAPDPLDDPGLVEDEDDPRIARDGSVGGGSTGDGKSGSSKPATTDDDDDPKRARGDAGYPGPDDTGGGGLYIPEELAHVLRVPGTGTASDPTPDGGDGGSGLPPFIKNPLGPLGFDPEAGDTGVTGVRGGGGHLPFRDPRGPGMMPVPDGDGPMGPAADGLHPIGSIGSASFATRFALGVG